MQVPFKAVWPPILLTVLDVAVAIPALTLGWWPLALALGLGAVILAFDIRGRARDYRNAYRHLVQGDDPARIAKTYRYSWCGRVACLSAAVDAGHACARAVDTFYRESGYRWFHIFPDNTFTLNSPFLSLRFWQITLFGNARASEVIAKGAPAQPSTAAVEVETEPVRRAA